MLKKICKYALSYLLMVSFNSSAQQALSIHQAIDMSIKNSGQLKVSKAKIDMATANLIAANNNKLPNFNISAAYLRLIQPNIDLAYKPGATQGGTQTSSTPTINQASYAMANLSYPIYAGGKIKYGIESAKYLQQAAMLDADNDKDAIALNAINAFINIYKAELTVGILKKNLAAAQLRDSSFSRLEQNGIIPRNDLLKTELQTSSIELNLLEAESNVELAAVNLNLMLGIKGNEMPLLDTAGISQINPLPFDEYQARALQSRKDLSAMAIRKKAAETGIKSAKADGLPTIALTGGYVAAYVPKFITITNAVNAGIGIQYNLASLWKTNAKLAEAKAREAEVIADQQLLNDAIVYQVNQAYSTFILSSKKIDVYNKAAAQAAENYRITKNKYDNSLVTVTELLDADVANQQAVLNVTLAKADQVAAYNKLLQTSGILKY